MQCWVSARGEYLLEGDSSMYILINPLWEKMALDRNSNKVAFH